MNSACESKMILWGLYRTCGRSTVEASGLKKMGICHAELARQEATREMWAVDVPQRPVFYISHPHPSQAREW